MPARRAVAAATALLLGVAFCFVMYSWQLRYSYAFHDPLANLVFAIPFVGLAVMVAGGMSRPAAAASWLVLAGLTGFAYVAAATSSDSTAVLVFIAPFVYGAFGVSVIFAIDSVVRSRSVRRRRPELG